MAEKKKRTKAQQVLDGLNKGLLADTLGGPVDLATLAINAPISLASYAGQKMGLLDEPLRTIEKPFLGSEYIADQMAARASYRLTVRQRCSKTPCAWALASSARPA